MTLREEEVPQTQALQPLPTTSRSAPRGPFPADTQEGLLCCWRNNCCSSSGGRKSPHNRLILVLRLDRDTSRRSRSQQHHRTSAARLRHWKIGLTGNCSLPDVHGQSRRPRAGPRLDLHRERNAFFLRAPQQPRKNGGQHHSLRLAAPKHTGIQTTSPAAANAHGKTTRGTSS